MFFLTKKYQRLQNRSPDDSEQKFHYQNPGIYRLAARCTPVLLLASILINCLLLYSNSRLPAAAISKSEFAHLSNDIPQEYFHPMAGDPLSDEEWDSIPKINGILALGDEYTSRFPPSQLWPWDSSKQVFFLQGHHNLHCLKQLRQSIFEYRHHILQTQHWHHIDHCFEVLRDDVICTADDTPRTVNPLLNGLGLGQTRFCRDWTKLDEWAEKHSACFKINDTTRHDNNQIDVYKHCPDGSRPWENMGNID